MATIVNTGQTLTLTINSIARSEQVTSARLNVAETRNRYKLLNNTETQAVVDTIATLDCEILLDWSSGTSDFADALWTAYTSAPNTTIPFVLATNGQTFSGALYPNCPPAGGSSSDIHSWSTTFQLAGVPTKS